MITRTVTQRDLVREALLNGEAITPLDALNRWGCFRLGARVHDLKKQGLDITSEMVETPNGARVAQYRLAPREGQMNLW